MSYEIRPIRDDEIHLLSDFLYQAIFRRAEDAPLPRSIIEQPEIEVFISDYGKKDDNCLVTVAENKIVGAVWTRILSGPVKGFGNIDDRTPEFAVSLFEEYRGRGIGTHLMREMLVLLKEKGYRQASLAVQKDNYAVKMYKSVGFAIADENREEYIMLCKL